jgi:hypothetical protein
MLKQQLLVKNGITYSKSDFNKHYDANKGI